MRRGIAVVVAVLGLATSCTRSTTPPVAAPLPTVPRTSSAPGPCANPFLPSAAGDAWYYRISVGSRHDTYADTVTTVGDDSFVITSNYTLLAAGTRWTCGPEGLTSLGAGGSAAGTITTYAFGQTIASHHARGLTLPSRPAPGDRWRQSLDFTMGGLVPAKGTIRIRYRALRFDRVATRAGRFRALLVHAYARYDVRSRRGSDGHLRATVLEGQWWVRGVGLVRQDAETHVSGETYRAVAELTRFEKSTGR